MSPRPVRAGSGFEGSAHALLFALSGLPPALDDVCWRVIEQAPRRFSLQDIALLLVAGAEAGCRHGEPIENVRNLLEHRIKIFCFCLNDDDAADFRRFLAMELDARSW